MRYAHRTFVIHTALNLDETESGQREFPSCRQAARVFSVWLQRERMSDTSYRPDTKQPRKPVGRPRVGHVRVKAAALQWKRLCGFPRAIYLPLV